MSRDLATKIQLGLGELTQIREQLSPLIARTDEPDLPLMETAAACAMLHSFYTEIEKILKIIALDFDGEIASSEAWHRDLLNQMSRATAARPAYSLGPAKSALGTHFQVSLCGANIKTITLKTGSYQEIALTV